MKRLQAKIKTAAEWQEKARLANQPGLELHARRRKNFLHALQMGRIMEIKPSLGRLFSNREILELRRINELLGAQKNKPPKTAKGKERLELRKKYAVELTELQKAQKLATQKNMVAMLHEFVKSRGQAETGDFWSSQLGKKLLVRETGTVRRNVRLGLEGTSEKFAEFLRKKGWKDFEIKYFIEHLKAR